jgi:hypothetical protein
VSPPGANLPPVTLNSPHWKKILTTGVDDIGGKFANCDIVSLQHAKITSNVFGKNGLSKMKQYR